MRLTAVRPKDTGSVLALVPAGFLVLILLGGLAVDSAVAYQRQHQLHDALSAAANDAVSAGLNDRSFYAGTGVVLDPNTVASVVCRSMAAQDLPALHRLRLAVALTGDAVRVRASATISPVFGRAIPGFGDRQVSSTADATLSAGTQAGGSNPVPAPSATFGPLNSIYCA